MIRLKFNTYFNLWLYPKDKNEDLPFKVGEILIIKLRLAFTQNVDEKTRSSEVYATTNAKLAANFLVQEWEEDNTRLCEVHQVNDDIKYTVALHDDASANIQAILTIGDKETKFPIENGQAISVPFEVFAVDRLWGTDQVISIAPAGEKTGQLVTTDVELIDHI